MSEKLGRPLLQVAALGIFAGFDLVRLGLTIAAIADLCTPRAPKRLITQIAGEAITAHDGYAAHDILSHCVPELLPGQQRALRAILEASGLGAGHISSTLQRQITRAVKVGNTTVSFSFQARMHK